MVKHASHVSSVIVTGSASGASSGESITFSSMANMHKSAHTGSYNIAAKLDAPDVPSVLSSVTTRMIGVMSVVRHCASSLLLVSSTCFEVLKVGKCTSSEKAGPTRKYSNPV